MDKRSTLLLGISLFPAYISTILALPFRPGSPPWTPPATSSLVLDKSNRRGDLFPPGFHDQIGHYHVHHPSDHRLPPKPPVDHPDVVQNNHFRRTDKHRDQPSMMTAGRPVGQAMAMGVRPPAGQAMGAGQAAGSPPSKPSFSANAEIFDENVFLFIATGIAAILAKARGTDIDFFGPVIGRRSVDETVVKTSDEIAAGILVRALEMDTETANRSDVLTSSCTQRAACEVPDNARNMAKALEVLAWMAEIGLDWISVSPGHILDVIGRLREGADHGNSTSFCDELFPCPQLALCNNCVPNLQEVPEETR